MKKKSLMILVCLLSLSALLLLAACGNSSTSKSSILGEDTLAVYMPSDRPIRIAQFADLHFGTEGNNYHNNRVERTKAYMQYIVDTEKPDLIVCSGDNIMTTGVEHLKEFVDLMESYKIPWTFIYGNHDAESTAAGYCKRDLSTFLCTYETEYLLYDTGYIDESNNRYGNFSISVLNHDGSELLGAVILMDGGSYDSSVSSYDSITEGQIAWYESEIDRLDELYTGEGTMPSMVFSHIQLPEYFTAYKAALTGDGAEFIIEEKLTSLEMNSVRKGGPTNVNTGFFDTMKKKESTVAFFCGHEHVVGFQVEMDGIVLGFGPQTGFSTLFADNDMPRRTYIYCFDENFDFTTICCEEDVSDIGLCYTGTFDSDGEYDEASGTYTLSHNFNSGNSIQLSYKGVRLTTENTTITGNLSASYADAQNGGFYSSDGKTFLYVGTSANTCTLTYDPAKNTLNIASQDVEANPEAPTSLSIKTINSDAGADAIALWTEVGAKLKSVEDTSAKSENWLGNNWRYYVVVDSEGRIAYAVLHPLSGYGGPTGKSYYAHPYYTNYTTNPAIKLLDGFVDDWSSGGFGYTLFEIVVPEGGFAITGHGTAVDNIIDMISQGTVEDYGVTNVNTRSVYNSNIRLSYDENEKTVSIYTVDEE